MQRQYLYVMDPIESINPLADTTFSFMLESEKRGIRNLYCQIEDLYVQDGKGHALAAQIQVQYPNPKTPIHYSLGEPFEYSFDDFSIIWMRKDPPVDARFLTATMILDHHDPAKTLILNNPAGLRVANEKLWCLQFSDLMPSTLVATSAKIISKTIDSLGRVVLKPVYGAGGAGVMVLDSSDRNLSAAIELISEQGKHPIVVQEYVKNARQGDKRVILLGGEPIGAVLRVPTEHEHRANLHVGGKAVQCEITYHDRKIAQRLKPHLLANGLHFVGLDIIGDKVTEINVTSPTGVQEIDQLDGRSGSDRMSAQVMDYAERL